MILDSSSLIATERRRFDLVGFLSANSTENFFITAVTASELLHGCARATDDVIRVRRTRFVEGVLQAYPVLTFGLKEAREHARLWVELELKGKVIGERDLLIAAIAKANAYSVATLNRGEFERVSGLALAETAPWLKDQ